MKFFSRLFSRRSGIANPQKWLIDYFTGGTKSAAGINVTPDTALQASAVYACVRVLAETIASLPLHVYRRLEGSKGKEKAPEHYLYPVLHEIANPEMTSFELRETMVGHLCLRGNAYAEKVFDRAGRVKELWPLNPDGVLVERDKATKQLIYIITLPGESKQVKLSSDRILHIRGLSGNGIIGYSPIALAKESIGLALATEEYGSRFFGNASRPSGVLEHPGKLGKDAADRLKKSWEEMHRGLSNAHRVAILEEGLKWNQIGMTQEDSQYLQTRQYQVVDIARIFRVPPHMIAELTRATFCLPADVEVLTELGPRNIVEIKPGDVVWSYNGDRMVKAIVKNIMCSGEDEVLEIKTTNRTIRANARHKILVRKKYNKPLKGRGGYQNIEWKNEYIEAGNLKVGDTMVCVGKIPGDGVDYSPTRKVSIGFMEFCGLLLGDGNVFSGSISIARANNTTYMEHYRQIIKNEFTCGNTIPTNGEDHGCSKLTQSQVNEIRMLSNRVISNAVVARKFKANPCTISTIARGRQYHTNHHQAGIGEYDLNTIKKLLKNRLTVREIAKRYNVDKSTIRNILTEKTWHRPQPFDSRPIHLKEGDRQTRFSSVVAAKELRMLGFSGKAKTKSVPGWIFTLNTDLKLAFLRGFLDADGSVDKKGRIAYHSVNKKMLSQIRHLCMMCGIPVTNIRKTSRRVTLPNGNKFDSICYGFTCSNPEANLKIGSNDLRYVERLKNGKPFNKKDRNYPRYGGREFNTEECLLARITDIAKQKKEKVYDLEVSGTHSFIANGVIVHNSNIEQQSIDFVVNTIRPWLVRFEQAFKQRLFDETDREHYAEFSIDGLLRGDIASRYSAYAVGRQWGWLSADDIREMENRNPLPDGQGETYLVPLNMIPAGETAKIGDIAKELPKNEDQKQKTRDAFAPVMKEVGSRIVRRERSDILRQLKKSKDIGDFREWLDVFYEDHAVFIRKNIKPVFESYRKIAGYDDITMSTELYINRHMADLRDKIITLTDSRNYDTTTLVNALEAVFNELESEATGGKIN